MEVKKLYLTSAVIYLTALIGMTVVWLLYTWAIATEIGFWIFAPSLIVGAILNEERKKVGLTLHEILVTDPVRTRRASMVLAPGDYDYKIEEVVSRYSGRKDYVVLVRPLGSRGFTLVKGAYLVEDYASHLQDQLLDLQIASPEAAKAIVAYLKKDVREAKSDYWHVEYREKKIKEYEELFLS